MDREYIEAEHVVDRYLSGDLTVREAREFERYCRDHPQALKTMPIPVRLKARLARHPLQDSETGMFEAIPSSATHAAVEAAEEGFEADDDGVRHGPWSPARGANRAVVIGLALALVAALAGLIGYGMRASSLSKQLQSAQRALDDIGALQMQAPGSAQTHRVQLVRQQPEQATLALGWPTPPQLLDIHVDVAQGRYNQFQITIDKVDAGRLLQIRRVARDSNRELRFGLNSSAFGPGEYLFKIDGYTWRGQTEEVGWFRVDLRKP